MSDLVQRLRTDADLFMQWNIWWETETTKAPDPLDYEKTACLEVEAADHIEALEAALRDIERTSHICGVTTRCGAIARRALEGKTV